MLYSLAGANARADLLPHELAPQRERVRQFKACHPGRRADTLAGFLWQILACAGERRCRLGRYTAVASVWQRRIVRRPQQRSPVSCGSARPGTGKLRDAGKWFKHEIDFYFSCWRAEDGVAENGLVPAGRPETEGPEGLRPLRDGVPEWDGEDPSRTTEAPSCRRVAASSRPRPPADARRRAVPAPIGRNTGCSQK